MPRNRNKGLTKSGTDRDEVRWLRRKRDEGKTLSWLDGLQGDYLGPCCCNRGSKIGRAKRSGNLSKSGYYLVRHMERCGRRRN